MSAGEQKDSVSRAPESGEHDAAAQPVDRFTGEATPAGKTADGGTAGPTPPGQPKLGDDFESGRQSTK